MRNILKTYLFAVVDKGGVEIGSAVDNYVDLRFALPDLRVTFVYRSYHQPGAAVL